MGAKNHQDRSSTGCQPADLAPDVLLHTDDDIVAVWRSLLVVQSLRRPSMVGATAIADGLGRLLHRGVRRPVFFVYVSSEAAPPADEVRRRISTTLNDPRIGLAGHVILFAGSPFRATIVRSVVTSMNLFTRASHPSTAVSSRTKAVDELCSYMKRASTDPAPTRVELATFLDAWLPEQAR